MFNPQVIVVGGSLADVLTLEQRTVESELDQRAMAAARAGVTVTVAGLQGDSSLIGASELAFQALLTAPDSAVFAVAAN